MAFDILERDHFQHYAGPAFRQKTALTAEQTLTIQTDFKSLKHVVVTTELAATPKPTITHAAGVLTIDFGAPITDVVYVDANGI